MRIIRTVWTARGRTICDQHPVIMGIVNTTPDSFSDGGASFALNAAIHHAMRLIDEGASIIDIGGESSRPGSDPVSLDEELRRVIPVVEALRNRSAIPISVDTTKAEVARRALSAGAEIVNDITALGDPGMVDVVCEANAGLVLMHMAGTPKTMQTDPSYTNPTHEVLEFLNERAQTVKSRGLPHTNVVLDPGIGFGKTLEHNLELLRNTATFATLGSAVLVGTSRKSFLGTVTGRPVSERLIGSVASSLMAVDRGASIVRVHDVAAMRDALLVWEALQTPN